MARRSRRRDRRKNRAGEGEDINPLAYMANMSDAMLILAVGIMLALIVHWNVDVSTTGGNMGGDETPKVNGEEQIDTENAISFEQNNMEEMDNPEDLEDGDGMSRLGEVYYDSASGKYYVIKNEEE